MNFVKLMKNIAGAGATWLGLAIFHLAHGMHEQTACQLGVLEFFSFVFFVGGVCFLLLDA